MAQADTKKLDTGDSFPHLELRLVDGRSFTLPSDLNGHWSVLLIYRGHW